MCFAALLYKGVFFRRGLWAAPFLFMDEKNNNSGTEREKEVIDLQAVADDNAKRVGEVIEAAFLSKVCKLRIPVCKPWGDSERYDFVVDWGNGFWSVQVKAGSTATADDIRAFCREHLADFKVPEYVEIRDQPLPRNPAGKVLKSVLRGGDSAFATADDQAL